MFNGLTVLTSTSKPLKTVLRLVSSFITGLKPGVNESSERDHLTVRTLKGCKIARTVFLAPFQGAIASDAIPGVSASLRPPAAFFQPFGLNYVAQKFHGCD